MGSFTNLFGKSPRVVVVEAFAENPESELSVPEIQRISGKNKRSLYAHIEKLLHEGIIIKKRKEGKCQFFGFNPEDPRGEALIFLESMLVKGNLEQQIKKDEGIPFDKPFPYYKYPTIDWIIFPIFKKEKDDIDTVNENLRPIFLIPLPATSLRTTPYIHVETVTQYSLESLEASGSVGGNDI